MTHRSFVLVPFLLLFTLIISGLISMAENEFRTNRESHNASQIDAFSLIEIETIQRIKTQFKTFKPKDFDYKTGEWSIKVSFHDESADIIYSGKDIITARLDYDMVFENVLDYHLNDSSQSDID